MKPNVADFPSLVRWVADRYHNGVVDQISVRAGISGALVDRWVKGKVRRPTIDTLDRFCRAYRLDFNWVLTLIRRAAAVLLVLLASGAYPSRASVPPEVTHYKLPETKNILPLIGSALVALLRWATRRTIGVSPTLTPLGIGAINAAQHRRI